MKVVRDSKAKKTAKNGDEGTHAEGGKFTGVVTQEELIRVNKAFLPPEVNGARVLRVSFAAKARTHWHKHPAGQILYVVSGKGRVQEKRENSSELIEILEGDTVYTPPNVWHWHGAAPDSPMVHIAINLISQDIDEETNHREHWGEAVSDQDYGREPL